MDTSSEHPDEPDDRAGTAGRPDPAAPGAAAAANTAASAVSATAAAADASPGASAAPAPPSAADAAAVHAQLGRPPRGLRAVAHRCPCGNPDVVETRPRLEDGTPFPTLYYLTCPRAASAIGTLEADGVMKRMTARLAEDPELAAAYRAAHEDYLTRRDAIEVLKGFPSAGGMPDRVKCLHVLVGHALAAGPGVNPLGDEALAMLPEWWAKGPCVSPAEPPRPGDPAGPESGPPAPPSGPPGTEPAPAETEPAPAEPPPAPSETPSVPPSEGNPR